MSQNKNNSTTRNWMIGIAIGAPISLLFAVIINPAFIGVGVAIGVSIATALNEKRSSYF